MEKSPGCLLSAVILFVAFVLPLIVIGIADSDSFRHEYRDLAQKVITGAVIWMIAWVIFGFIAGSKNNATSNGQVVIVNKSPFSGCVGCLLVIILVFILAPVLLFILKVGFIVALLGPIIEKIQSLL